MQTSSSGAQETLMLHGLGNAPLAAFVDLVSCNMYHVLFFFIIIIFYLSRVDKLQWLPYET